MAQLKVKQISDFVSAVEGKINGIVGTENVTAISVAKSEAISTANSADVVVLSSAKSYADQAEADAVATAAADATTKASTALSTAISADVVVLSSAKSYADAAEADANTEAGRLDGIVLSSAKSYADQAEADAITEAGRLDGIVLSSAKAHSDIQKGRIDALLDDSEGTLDTFKEISDFITSLETGDVAGLSTALSTAVSNDAVHSTAISTNAQAIADLDYTGDFDALGAADAAEANAIAEAGRLDAEVYNSAKAYADSLAVNYDGVGSADAAEADANTEAGRLDGIVLSSAKSYADAAEADAITAANTEAGRLDGIVLSSAKSYADAAEADANTEAGRLDGIVLSSAKSYADVAEADAISSANSYTDTEIATLDSRIDGLEGASFEEVVATFTNATQFSTGVRFNLDNVKVFVNGLQIHETSEGFDGWVSPDGVTFDVVNLGYDLEGDDHIIVSGRLA